MAYISIAESLGEAYRQAGHAALPILRNILCCRNFRRDDLQRNRDAAGFSLAGLRSGLRRTRAQLVQPRLDDLDFLIAGLIDLSHVEPTARLP